MSTTATARRQKWQYPQPPTPRILHLTGRSRRKPQRAAARPVCGESRRDRMVKLETLFEQERRFSRSRRVVGSVPIVFLEHCDDGGVEERERRRERVESEYECEYGEEEKEEAGGGGGGGGEAAVEEERWRFQAEVLRAECNLLRMEREIAVKKFERSRVSIERSLQSAIHTLINGKNKASEGKNMNTVLVEEMKYLIGKLKELRKSLKVKDFRARKYSNFDEQVTVLQRRLRKLSNASSENNHREIREIAESSLLVDTNWGPDDSLLSDGNCKVEILRRKMEGLSKDMLLERIEKEYGVINSAANKSVASLASSSKRIEWQPSSTPSSTCQTGMEIVPHKESGACSGHCKSVVRRVLEQVRAETEQWSQMQEMLRQVRDEMEELQASRDFWEERAVDSDIEVRSLSSAVQEWRHEALSSQAKVSDLQAKVSALQEENERLRREREGARQSSLQNETEKRVLICHLRENRQEYDNKCKLKEPSSDRRRKTHTRRSTGRALMAPKRAPFQDIGNTSSMFRA